ncbi:unnamed protein product, partial [Closterium sp. NIES-53]
VLDPPVLEDDFYPNLVDWSSTNVLAVGRGSFSFPLSFSPPSFSHPSPGVGRARATGRFLSELGRLCSPRHSPPRALTALLLSFSPPHFVPHHQVLDALALLDDFYLNLVDWSSTTVLAVGLNSCSSSPSHSPSLFPTHHQVLDAPALQDDFYLNLVDWSSTNVLAVGLGSCVYLWSAASSKARGAARATTCWSAALSLSLVELRAVLDAPALQDDFYLNLVDWSSTNVLAVGLGSCVYLWSAASSKVIKINPVQASGVPPAARLLDSLSNVSSGIVLLKICGAPRQKVIFLHLECRQRQAVQQESSDIKYLWSAAVLP